MSVEDEIKSTVQTVGAAKGQPGEAPLSPAAAVGMVSIVASIISTLLIRIGARTSFVILSFWIGKESESAALVVLVIECFYISELLLAPLVGVLSDRKGRKPFMLYAPVVGAFASLVLAGTSFLFPNPQLNASNFSLELVAILILVMVGRLLEGSAAALNAPSNLGYLTDTTVGDERFRVRVLTAYEVVTISGIALAIPFGGLVWSMIGRAGFFVAVAVYALCYIVIAIWMKESLNRTNAAGQHGSIREYREILTNKRIFTFVPAWLAINAMIGAWLTLSLIILAYPTSTCRVALEKVTDNIKPAVQAFSQNYCAITHGEVNADARFPNQLLHGGFLPGEASNIVGLYGVVFILGMGIWTVFVPKMRRTSVMVLALGGLFVSCGALLLINGLGNNPLTITETARNEMWVLLPIVLISVVVMSGFTPAALTHMAAISETLPGKRGAVMGLYSVLLGLGQLVGVFVGGLFVDLQGFNGLMIYSLILGVISLGSVIYMRSHNHDIDDHLKPGQQIAH
ncbi:MAG: transporter [Chloroflexi bacterium]|jgi:MFS family permease|nr:transporter [Chloroflexota bacterium]